MCPPPTNPTFPAFNATRRHRRDPVVNHPTNWYCPICRDTMDVGLKDDHMKRRHQIAEELGQKREIEPEPGDPLSWTCKFCDVTVNIFYRDEHISTRVHARNMRRVAREEEATIRPVKPSIPMWYCGVCDEAMSVFFQAEHLTGKQHFRMLRGKGLDGESVACTGVDVEELADDLAGGDDHGTNSDTTHSPSIHTRSTISSPTTTANTTFNYLNSADEFPLPENGPQNSSGYMCHICRKRMPIDRLESHLESHQHPGPAQQLEPSQKPEPSQQPEPNQQQEPNLQPEPSKHTQLSGEPRTFHCNICDTESPTKERHEHASGAWKCHICYRNLHIDWRSSHLSHHNQHPEILILPPAEPETTIDIPPPLSFTDRRSLLTQQDPPPPLEISPPPADEEPQHFYCSICNAEYAVERRERHLSAAWECVVCQKVMHQDSRNMHLSGRTHRNRAKKAASTSEGGGQSVAKFYCGVCDGNYNTGDAHLNGKQHRNNLAAKQRMIPANDTPPESPKDLFPSETPAENFGRESVNAGEIHPQSLGALVELSETFYCDICMKYVAPEQERIHRSKAWDCVVCGVVIHSAWKFTHLKRRNHRRRQERREREEREKGGRGVLEGRVTEKMEEEERGMDVDGDEEERVVEEKGEEEKVMEERVEKDQMVMEVNGEVKGEDISGAVVDLTAEQRREEVQGGVEDDALSAPEERREMKAPEEEGKEVTLGSSVTPFMEWGEEPQGDLAEEVALDPVVITLPEHCITPEQVMSPRSVQAHLPEPDIPEDRFHNEEIEETVLPSSMVVITPEDDPATESQRSFQTHTPEPENPEDPLPSDRMIPEAKFYCNLCERNVKLENQSTHLNNKKHRHHKQKLEGKQVKSQPTMAPEEMFYCGVCERNYPLEKKRFHTSRAWECELCHVSIHTEWKKGHMAGGKHSKQQQEREVMVIAGSVLNSPATTATHDISPTKPGWFHCGLCEGEYKDRFLRVHESGAWECKWCDMAMHSVYRTSHEAGSKHIKRKTEMVEVVERSKERVETDNLNVGIWECVVCDMKMPMNMKRHHEWRPDHADKRMVAEMVEMMEKLTLGDTGRIREGDAARHRYEYWPHS